jgi:hypothetical protein
MCFSTPLRRIAVSERSNIEIVEQLKKQSDVLYAKVLDDQSKERRKLESGEEHDKFLAEVNSLFDGLEDITPEIRLLDDYSWLLNTSLQWQAFASLLRIGRRIKIPEPPIRLWAPTQLLGKEDVDQWLASLGIQLCKIRQYRDFVQRVTKGEVEFVDKYNAKLYLCRDVLGGATQSLSEKLDFIEKLPPDAYSYLEEVWFRDVIELDAYLIWEGRGAQKERLEERRQGDYLDACEDYRRILANQGIKREPEKFISIRNYLSRKYMEGGRETLNANQRHELVARKAEQLSKYAKRPADKHADFVEAAAYVDGFYNNIIPAVVRADREASEGVRTAILRSEGKHSRLSIMNCLEAGICLYFLRGFEYFATDWKEFSDEKVGD